MAGMNTAYPVIFLPPVYANDDDAIDTDLLEMRQSEIVWSSVWRDMARRKVAMISRVAGALNTRN